MTFAGKDMGRELFRCPGWQPQWDSLGRVLAVLQSLKGHQCVSILDGLTGAPMAALAVWPAYQQLKQLRWLPDSSGVVVHTGGQMHLGGSRHLSRRRSHESMSWSILRLLVLGLCRWTRDFAACWACPTSCPLDHVACTLVAASDKHALQHGSRHHHRLSAESARQSVAHTAALQIVGSTGCDAEPPGSSCQL